MKKWFSIIFIITVSVLGACTVPGGSGSSTNGYQLAAISSYAGTEDIASIYKFGNYLYAAAKYDGLIVFSVSNVSNIVKVTGGSYVPAGNYPVNDVIVKTVGSATYAFLLLGNVNGSGAFTVVDVTDPTNITNISPVQALAGCNGTRMLLPDDTTAYVADYNLGFVKVDTDSGSGFAAPALDTTASLGAPAVGLCFDGTYAYVAAKSSGVFVITPGALTASSTINAQISTAISFANSVAYSSTTLVIADRMSGILLYDITLPAKPKYKGTYDTPGDAFDVVVNGTDVLVADGSNGVLWLDINNPASPTLRASVTETSSIAYRVFYNSGTSPYLYVSYGPGGIKIFEKKSN